MKTLLRRYLFLLALMFWQGGFTFYAAVVVPIGSDILGSHQQQGWVARSVTNYLNLSGLAALAFWGWEISDGADPVRGRQQLRWLIWMLLVVLMALLVWMHIRLDEYLDVEQFTITNRAAFRFWHRWYLHTSTAQWTGSLILTALTLMAWRSADSSPNIPHAAG